MSTNLLSHTPTSSGKIPRRVKIIITAKRNYILTSKSYSKSTCECYGQKTTNVWCYSVTATALRWAGCQTVMSTTLIKKQGSFSHHYQSNHFLLMWVVVDPRNTRCEYDVHTGWNTSPTQRQHTYTITLQRWKEQPIT